MSDRRMFGGILRRSVCSAITVSLSAALALSCISYAHAVSVVSGPTTTPSTPIAGSTGVTYSFGAYRITAGERCTGYSVTFPDGTGVSGATALSPAGTLAVAGQTVTVTFSSPITNENPFTVSIGGIRNPTVAGTFNAGSIAFYATNPRGKPKDPQLLATGDYTIVLPEMSITIDRASLDFGELMPDETPPPQDVRVTVGSTVPCQITRTLSGDVSELGLSVTGGGSGSKPAGTATYTDTYRIAPTWHSPAGTPLAASVSYAVTP